MEKDSFLYNQGLTEQFDIILSDKYYKRRQLDSGKPQEATGDWQGSHIFITMGQHYSGSAWFLLLL